jgi:hypothetical protein
LVKYGNARKSEHTTITGSKLWMKSDYINDESLTLYKYKIGRIYSCYYSNDLKIVQWKKPKDFVLILLMICGQASTSLCIMLLFTHCRNKRRSNSTYHDIIIQNTPPRSATPAQRWPETRNIRLAMLLPQSATLPEDTILETPPPLYSPSMYVAEAEGIPSTPPPRYTPPMAYVGREQENIPLTPPPNYVPSST